MTPTPSVPPTSLSVAGVQGLPFTISANRANRTEMILPSWARPKIGLIQKCVLLLRDVTDAFSASSRKPARMRSALSSMARIEEINSGGVLALRAIGFPGHS